MRKLIPAVTKRTHGKRHEPTRGAYRLVLNGHFARQNPLRIKDPHKKDLIGWMDERGISRYQFTFNGSSKADRSNAELIKYVRHCLWKQQSDPNIKQLLQMYDHEMDQWKNGKTERKRCYVSTYGQDEWDSILIDPDPQSKPEFDLSNLVEYWKKKVFKEKAWGIRKSLKNDDFPIALRHDLLNEQLKTKDFNQVR